MGYNEEYEDYLLVEGDYETGIYSYGVSLPGYMSFGGNLSISQAPLSGSNEPTEEEQGTFDEFKEEIKVLYDKMNYMWGIK